MATYDSEHTGQQVDEAVDIVLANKSKGDASTPVYFNSSGIAVAVEKDATPTEDSENLVESGGVYTELSAKVPKTDIDTNVNLGTSNTKIPSQGAVKSYVDAGLATKQDIVSAGDGIVKEGNTLSIDNDNDFMTAGKLDNKWSHFVSGLDVGYGTETIEKMENAKSSTFDITKFNAVKNGSPKVTNDGIMKKTGISTGNKFFTNLTNSDTFKIKYRCSFKPSEQIFSQQTGECFMSLQLGTNSYIRLLASGSDVQNISSVAFIYRKLTDTIEHTIGFNFNQSVGLGEPIDVEVIYDLTNIIFNIYSGNTLIATKTETASDFINSESQISAQNYYGWYSYNIVTYYLPYTYVVVNGTETLNFNKTGIDTIKPDDYTVVGSPTISDDGIASGFSQGNYIAIDNIYQITKALNIKCKFKIHSITGITYDGIIGTDYSNSRQRFSLICNFGKISLSSNGDNFTTLTSTNDFVLNKWYNADYGIDILNNKVYLNLYNEDGTVFYSDDTIITSDFVKDFKFLIGSQYNQYPFTNGSIDLNAFKIYVDGDLVYQPCLLIPYTLTKDGKKIVDSIYRSRVEDEYIQAGFTPYYTLSDTDYTMATVKESAIVDSYDNGMNKWTKYADLTLKQQGSCTSGTAVQFAKQFRDANYALSVPYTSGTKTATGFTPSFTNNCDYIAIGKCNLTFPQE